MISSLRIKFPDACSGNYWSLVLFFTETKVMGGRVGKMASVAVAMIFGFLPASLSAESVTILTEGLENGLPTNATNIGTGTIVASTAGAHSGGHRFQFVGDTDPTTVSSLTWPVDVTGYSGVSVEFASKFNPGTESTDLATVKVSAFDNPLQAPIIVPFSNQPTGDWSIIKVDLPAELANRQLNISFTADFNSPTGDAWSIDDVRFSGTPMVPEPATIGLLAFGVLTLARRRFR